MTHTLRLDTRIAEDRRVTFTAPDEVPVGEVEMVVVMVPREERQRTTGRDLLESEIFGMWRDRDDIKDSSDFARKQREQAWQRAA
ncbi:hypothetical protein BH11ARM2_BH11ARM2_26340 [soil metagenome]